MSKKKALLTAIIIIFLISGAYLVWLLCAKEDDTQSATTSIGGESTAQTPPISQDAITVEKNKVTITTLEKWEEFNTTLPDSHYFSDQCLSFFNMIISANSPYSEFQTVKLGSWEIVRDNTKHNANQLEFNFTVTESKLDTLGVGNYKTVITDGLACTLEFIGDDPRVKDELSSPSPLANAICDWISSTNSWSTPNYGDNSFITSQNTIADYFIARYGDGYKISEYDFRTLMSDKFGIESDDSKFDSKLLTVIDRELYILQQPSHRTTHSQFIVTDEKQTADGITTVTVLFFADSTKFIRSDIVEYYIDSEERIIGCKRIHKSAYEPLGVHNSFWSES